MLKRSVKAAVRLGLRNPRVRRLLAAELARQRDPAVHHASAKVAGAAPGATAATTAAMTAASAATFVDSLGVSHPLDPGLRDALKPGWRTMTDPVAAAQPPTDTAIEARTVAAGRSVADAARIVETLSETGFTGRILEVGCYDGAAAYQLAAREGATQVVATDLARYYVAQRPGQASSSALEDQQASLATLRERARVAAHAPADVVDFVEDDVNDSALEPGTFDAIVSFEVLEHLARPDSAFASMARLLRPGGLLYHDYNPFFSLIGGHSLCTLDFAWGHARLSEADVERYLSEMRPTEADQAGRFFRDSLNRMTLADLGEAMGSAGLEVMAVVPWVDRTLVGGLTSTTLAEVQRHYPSARLEDLLATFVTVVARRPAAA